MAEWFKAAVLKTASREPGRGFGDPEGGGGVSGASEHILLPRSKIDEEVRGLSVRSSY
jgi:hypothetical protein